VLEVLSPFEKGGIRRIFYHPKPPMPRVPGTGGTEYHQVGLRGRAGRRLYGASGWWDKRPKGTLDTGFCQYGLLVNGWIPNQVGNDVQKCRYLVPPAFNFRDIIML
jgi:hypothetical protein